MSALLNTLPGDIPGLLSKWSPVLVTIDSDKPPVRGVVIDPIIEPDEPDLRCLVWNERNGRDNKAAMLLRLDLTDLWTGERRQIEIGIAAAEAERDAYQRILTFINS